jgi:hypothetical protein
MVTSVASRIIADPPIFARIVFDLKKTQAGTMNIVSNAAARVSARHPKAAPVRTESPVRLRDGGSSGMRSARRRASRSRKMKVVSDHK